MGKSLLVGLWLCSCSFKNLLHIDYIILNFKKIISKSKEIFILKFC